MEWLNYHHLLYFWTVVREGGVVRAAEKLRLSQPTVSAQVKALEARLGEKLFTRVGRRLVPTDVGQVVYRYADEIFSLGRELLDTVQGRAPGRPMRLVVGVADVLSKQIAYRLLAPALELPTPVRVICREARAESLLAALALHEIDLVLADTPVPPTVHVKAYSHLLGESDVTCFAAPALAARLRRRFPHSLTGAPMLLPGEGTVVRRQLEDWFQATGIRPAIVGEFDDSALMKAFGEQGAGAFVGPTAIAAEIRRQYRVVPIGGIDAVRERFYAISYERRIKHPAVVAIAEAARAGVLKAAVVPGPVCALSGQPSPAGCRSRSASAFLLQLVGLLGISPLLAAVLLEARPAGGAAGSCRSAPRSSRAAARAPCRPPPCPLSSSPSPAARLEGDSPCGPFPRSTPPSGRSSAGCLARSASCAANAVHRLVELGPCRL